VEGYGHAFARSAGLPNHHIGDPLAIFSFCSALRPVSIVIWMMGMKQAPSVSFWRLSSGPSS
jgi:hypothetical protein